MHLKIASQDHPPEWMFESFPPDIAKQLWHEYKRGTSLKLKKALEEQNAIAYHNSKEQHRGVDGVGQVGRRIATSLRAELVNLYGEDALHDDAFMDRLNRENNFNFKPSYERKAQVSVTQKPY
jgi:hypothetical protein